MIYNIMSIAFVFSIFKEINLLSFILIISSLGFLYFHNSVNKKKEIKYIAGAVKNIDKEDEELIHIIKEFLNIYHHFNGKFKIISAKTQIVAGIKYIVTIKKEGKENIENLQFIYKAWEKKFEFIQ